MYINRMEGISTWAEEALVYRCMYTTDKKRIEDMSINIILLVEYYCDNIAYDDFIDVDTFTDWVHDLEDEELKALKAKL